MRMFCSDIYEIHRDYLMDRRALRSITEKLGFEVLHRNYLRTFRPSYFLPRAFGLGIPAVNELLRLDRIRLHEPLSVSGR